MAFLHFCFPFICISININKITFLGDKTHGESSAAIKNENSSILNGGTTKCGKKSNRKKVNGNNTINNNIASNATTESNLMMGLKLK